MRVTHTRADTAAALLLALAAVGLSGCVGAASRAEGLCFSPDGSKVAFVQDDTLGVGFAAESAYMKRVEYIRWADVTRPLLVHRVMVSRNESTAGATGWTFDAVRELRFSPDSRHVAARTDRRIVALDTATRKLSAVSRVAAGRKGMAWSGPAELVWWEEAVAEASGRRTAHLTVWRRRVGGASPAETVYHEADELDESERHLFYRASLSPHGRALVFGRTWRGRAKLLTVADGKVRHVGGEGLQLEAVSWRPDGSAALCHLAPWVDSAATAPAAGRSEAWLVELASAPALCPVPEFAGAGDQLRLLGARWTADGQYVPADDGAALCLVRPRPWAIHRLSDEALVAGSAADAAGPLPARGWLWGRRGDTAYAVDYRQQHRIRLATTRAWAVSPDGRRIAQVDRFGNLRIAALNLPKSNAGAVGRPAR